jgi:hypothetical protein
MSDLHSYGNVVVVVGVRDHEGVLKFLLNREIRRKLTLHEFNKRGRRCDLKDTMARVSLKRSFGTT